MVEQPKIASRLVEAARTTILTGSTFELIVDVIATDKQGVLVNMDAYTLAELKRAQEATTTYNKVTPTPLLSVRGLTPDQIGEFIQLITDGAITLRNVMANFDFAELDDVAKDAKEEEAKEKPAATETSPASGPVVSSSSSVSCDAVEP
jgi:hypothetical protein